MRRILRPVALRLWSWLDTRLSAQYRAAATLGRGDYDKRSDIRVLQFGDAESIDFVEPVHLQPLDAEFASLIGRREYPAPFVLDVAEGQLRGHDALALTQDGHVILESLLNHRPYLERVSAGRIYYPNTLGELRRQSRRARFTKVFVLANRFGNAYFHWLLESLPRLWLLKQYETATGERVPVLIEARPPRHVQETLRLLDVRDVLEWRDTAATAKHLLIPMALHGTGIPSPHVCRWVANELLDAARVDGAITPIGLPRIDAPFVYVSRRKATQRRVVNEDEILEQVLMPRGFHAFMLEDMTLPEQMALFRQAKAIVGAHGAGFSNAIFSRGAPLLELFEPGYLNACFYRLACAMNAPYALLLGESVGTDIRVPPALLTQTLDALLARATPSTMTPARAGTRS